jgi:hypothetical protein
MTNLDRPSNATSSAPPAADIRLPQRTLSVAARIAVEHPPAHRERCSWLLEQRIQQAAASMT